MALPFEVVERMPAGARARPKIKEGSWLARLSGALLVVLWLVLAGLVAVPGVSYYLLPLEARAFSPEHARYAPTGVLGLRLGIAGSALMLVGVVTYMARKRWSALARFGKLKYWLQFHIFLCTLGPFFILLHTSFKIGGLVSIAFWSMTLVVASGVFGRYVYARIPKTLNGRFRTKDELAQERAALLQAIEAATPGRALALPQRAFTTGTLSTKAALLQALRFNGRQRKREKQLRGWLEKIGIAPAARVALLQLVRRERELEQQIALVAPFQRLFRYWHLFHLPLALLMVAIVVVHIVIAVLFGYAWPF